MLSFYILQPLHTSTRYAKPGRNYTYSAIFLDKLKRGKLLFEHPLKIKMDETKNEFTSLVYSAIFLAFFS